MVISRLQETIQALGLEWAEEGRIVPNIVQKTNKKTNQKKTPN